MPPPHVGQVDISDLVMEFVHDRDAGVGNLQLLNSVGRPSAGSIGVDGAAQGLSANSVEIQHPDDGFKVRYRQPAAGAASTGHVGRSVRSDLN